MSEKISPIGHASLRDRETPRLRRAAGVAFATVIFRNHPAEVLYNRFIRRFTRTIALPPTARKRKVALAVAGGLLIGAGFAFFFDATQLGYAMGVSVKLFLRLLRG